MKKKFRRWYEKDDYTRVFMNLLRDLPTEKQCEVAIELIIKSSAMVDRDYEKMIQDVSSYDPKDFKRWYDKNPNVHLAVETLKELDANQREQLFSEFSHLLVDENENDIDLFELSSDIDLDDLENQEEL